MSIKRKAVFLDKDGTLVENRPLDRNPESFSLLPGTIEGLRLLHLAGYALIVVTNQGGIADGRLTEADLTAVEVALRIRLASSGIPLDGLYYCPHHPQGSIVRYSTDCRCRKPKPGMLLQAARDLQIDLARSWMVGDILHDVEAGRSAGCRTVLLTNGHETEWEMSAGRWPDLVADNLWEAAHALLEADQYLASGSGSGWKRTEHEPES